MDTGLVSINDVNRISRAVYKYGNSSTGLTLRHYVSMNRGTKFKDGNKEVAKEATHKFSYKTKDIITGKEYWNYSLLYDNFLGLSGTTLTYDEENRAKRTNCNTYMTNIDFPLIRIGLRESLKWLKDEKFEGLFTTDSSGKTVGISNNRLIEIVKLQYNMFLTFRPTVIYDSYEDINYQGIVIGCNRGLIGSLSAIEYECFATAFNDIMNNFYTASLMLYNVGLTLINTDDKLNTEVLLI